jgi:hypothetical protein
MLEEYVVDNFTSYFISEGQPGRDMCDLLVIRGFNGYELFYEFKPVMDVGHSLEDEVINLKHSNEIPSRRV